MHKTKDFILYFLTLSKHVLSVVMHIPTLEGMANFLRPMIGRDHFAGRLLARMIVEPFRQSKHKKAPNLYKIRCSTRRRRDSNSRNAFDVYAISSRAPSTKLGDFSTLCSIWFSGALFGTSDIIHECRSFVNS